jgi:hypothetical protein
VRKNRGWHLSTEGYIQKFINGKLVLKHRIIAEKKIGRKLRKGEISHHKNHIKTDNRPCNIEVMPSWLHSAMHITKDPVRKKYLGKIKPKYVVKKYYK